MYKKLEIKTIEGPYGIDSALKAMRLPTEGKAVHDDFTLAGKLIKRGDAHAKCMRGIVVWAAFKFQAGWMIELETHRIGMETLSTSSSMHNELKELFGIDLAEQKQSDISSKIYTRIAMFSYQNLRNIWILRRKHRHPDWQIFCDWIESLPYFDKFIMPEFVCNTEK